jgi:hypothetical protein
MWNIQASFMISCILVLKKYGKINYIKRPLRRIWIANIGDSRLKIFICALISLILSLLVYSLMFADSIINRPSKASERSDCN